MTILVTGATGYIGSHFAVLAQQQGHELLLIDNFSNSSSNVLNKIEAITHQPCHFIKADITNERDLDKVFNAGNDIEAVVHFAAVKYVSESFSNPQKYYKNNVVGSYLLLEKMREAKVKKLVFSSTASVYADAGEKAYQEDMLLHPVTPYGRSKLMFENILKDYCYSDPNFAAISLRYFNVAGAHSSGLLGEECKPESANIMPVIIQAAAGAIPKLSLFGNDYPTADGTAIRDYIHVMDMAEGHLQSLEFLQTHKGYEVFNLGSGSGYSLLELVNTFKQENKIDLPYEFTERRPGDLASVYACIDKAKQNLNWQANCTLKDIVHDAWHYYLNSRE